MEIGTAVLEVDATGITSLSPDVGEEEENSQSQRWLRVYELHCKRVAARAGGGSERDNVP